MAMHNPAHPGEVLRESCLKPLGLTVKKCGRGAWGDAQGAFGRLERA